MHTYVILRGIKDKLHRWIEDMTMQFIPYRTPQGEGLVQLAMRPVYLYEIVYPNQAHDAVMRMIQPNEGFDYTNEPQDRKLSEELKKTKKIAKRANIGVSWLRKILRLDPVKLPSDMNNYPPRSIYRQFIGVHPIGSKPDVNEEFKVEKI